MIIATFANLAGEAVKHGYRTIAYRDPCEDDLARQVARLIARLTTQHAGTGRILVLVGNTAQVFPLKLDLARYGVRGCGRIGLNGLGVQVGTLDNLDRRLRLPCDDYGIVVLLDGLDRERGSRLIARLPGVAVIDADAHGGQPIRPADHVLFRPIGGQLQSLQHTDEPITTRH